MDGTLQVPT